MDEYLIDLRKVQLNGNVLDISNNNYDIVYSLCKASFQEISVDYAEEEEDIKDKEFYHNVIMFFYLSRLWTNTKRKTIIKDILKNIRPDGELFIWDIDKKYGKTFNGKIMALLPDDNVKEIVVKDHNLACNINKSMIEEIILPYFTIEEQKSWGNVYYIRAKCRKGELKDESTANGGKL